MSNLTIQNKNTLHQFQAAGGCNINRILRGQSNFTLYYLESELMNKTERNKKHPRNIDENYTIVNELDDIIKNNSNTSTIKGVAYYKSLKSSGIPTDRIFGLIDQNGISSQEVQQELQNLIGLSMTDKAYGSRTIPEGKKTSYAKEYDSPQGSLAVKVISYISPGCGAYIDTYGGIVGGLGEMVIKRNCNQIIIDAYIDPKTNKLILETLYTP